MTNYIYRTRSGYVEITERVALPEGLTAQEAYDKHTAEFGTDNDLAFLSYANGKDVEITDIETSEILDSEDYPVWYATGEDDYDLMFDPLMRGIQERLAQLEEDNKE
jgi:hypothetical protein